MRNKRRRKTKEKNENEKRVKKKSGKKEKEKIRIQEASEEKGRKESVIKTRELTGSQIRRHDTNPKQLARWTQFGYFDKPG